MCDIRLDFMSTARKGTRQSVLYVLVLWVKYYYTCKKIKLVVVQDYFFACKYVECNLSEEILNILQRFRIFIL